MMKLFLQKKKNPMNLVNKYIGVIEGKINIGN